MPGAGRATTFFKGNHIHECSSSCGNSMARRVNNRRPRPSTLKLSPLRGRSPFLCRWRFRLPEHSVGCESDGNHLLKALCRRGKSVLRIADQNVSPQSVGALRETRRQHTRCRTFKRFKRIAGIISKKAIRARSQVCQQSDLVILKCKSLKTSGELNLPTLTREHREHGPNIGQGTPIGCRQEYSTRQ